MPTNYPRINMTFEPDKIKFLREEAKRTKQSVSSLAKELVLEALERREDMALSSLASLRDMNEHQKTVSHNDAWK